VKLQESVQVFAAEAQDSFPAAQADNRERRQASTSGVIPHPGFRHTQLGGHVFGGQKWCSTPLGRTGQFRVVFEVFHQLLVRVPIRNVAFGERQNLRSAIMQLQ
jgi:hypothetical protein